MVAAPGDRTRQGWGRLRESRALELLCGTARSRGFPSSASGQRGQEGELPEA